MFASVRHWWSGGRGKVTLRLFVFELLVVVVGVLIAQGLASWIGDRSNRRAMEQALARSDREIAQSLDSALVWKAAIPCLRGRLEAVQRAAAVGPVPSALVDRPALRSPATGEMPEAAALLYRQVAGDEAADQRDNIVYANQTLDDEILPISRNWARIGLADVRNGPVGPGDRLAARQAAADALASIRTIGIVAESVLRETERLGIRPLEQVPGRGPARSCDAIWAEGRIDPRR